MNIKKKARIFTNKKARVFVVGLTMSAILYGSCTYDFIKLDFETVEASQDFEIPEIMASFKDNPAHNSNLRNLDLQGLEIEDNIEEKISIASNEEKSHERRLGSTPVSRGGDVSRGKHNNPMGGSIIMPSRGTDLTQPAEDVYKEIETRYREEEERQQIAIKKFEEERLKEEKLKQDKIEAEKVEIERIKTEKLNKEKQEIENSSQKTDEYTSKKSKIIKAYPHKTFKSYMSWTALSKSSPQGKLSAKAKKDPSTGVMMYEGRYLVALGFAYAGPIGEHIDIVMESGQVIPAIVGDWKAKKDTDQYNSTCLSNGSIVEFIVGSNKDGKNATQKTGNYNTIFPGKVKEFRK